jgi:5-methylcytosine-specific restriction endonuclease McrA
MARKGQQYTWADFPPRKTAAGYHCRYCKKLLTGRKRAWCDKECTKKVLLLVDWRYIRNRIRRRDRWVCQMPVGTGICGRPATDVDHIIELADGGSFHDWANLRSMCRECHKAKTQLMRKLRAERKKLEKAGKGSITIPEEPYGKSNQDSI